MTGDLQRRLDQAREARREAGRLQAEAAARAFLPAPTEPGDAGVIDLRALISRRERTRPETTLSETTVTVPDAGADLHSDPNPGAGAGAGPLPGVNRPRLDERAGGSGPGTVTVATTAPASERCPRCGGSVRLDMFDAVEAVAHLTCLDCGLLFSARSPRA